MKQLDKPKPPAVDEDASPATSAVVESHSRRAEVDGRHPAVEVPADRPDLDLVAQAGDATRRLFLSIEANEVVRAKTKKTDRSGLDCRMTCHARVAQWES